jgi:hypothetical protein
MKVKVVLVGSVHIAKASSISSGMCGVFSSLRNDSDHFTDRDEQTRNRTSSGTLIIEIARTNGTICQN